MAAAKSYIETDRQVRSILEDVRSGIFKCVYLLMGEDAGSKERKARELGVPIIDLEQLKAMTGGE